MMWELLQITILGTNSKIVGTRTFRKFPYVELTLNTLNIRFIEENFYKMESVFLIKFLHKIVVLQSSSNEKFIL